MQPIEQFAAAHADDAAAQHVLGMILEALGRRDEALVHFQSAAKLEPKNELFELSVQTATQETPVRPAASPRAATPAKATALVASSAAPADPFDATQPSAPTAVRSATNERLQQSSLRIECVDSNDPTDKAAGARVRTDAAVQPAAASETATASDLSPDNEAATVKAALASLRTGDASAAAAILRPAVGRTPDSAALQHLLGTACYRLGDYAGARSALEQAIALDNDNALSYFLLGCTLNKLGRTDEGQRHLAEARRRDSRLSDRSATGMP